MKLHLKEIKQIRRGSGSVTLIQGTGKDLNNILGVDYLPVDHFFKLENGVLTDLTIGKEFK